MQLKSCESGIFFFLGGKRLCELVLHSYRFTNFSGEAIAILFHNAVWLDDRFRIIQVLCHKVHCDMETGVELLGNQSGKAINIEAMLLSVRRCWASTTGTRGSRKCAPRRGRCARSIRLALKVRHIKRMIFLLIDDILLKYEVAKIQKMLYFCIANYPVSE